MVLNTLATGAQALATPTNNTTATTTTAGGANTGLPAEFVALGVIAIVVMTVVWFYLKRKSGGSGPE